MGSTDNGNKNDKHFKKKNIKHGSQESSRVAFRPSKYVKNEEWFLRQG